MITRNNEAVIYCSGAEHLKSSSFYKLLPFESSVFKNGETRVKIIGSSREYDVVVIQSFDSKINDQIMELLLTIDALNRSGAKSVTVILPIFPYARQERKDDSGTPISARVVCDLLKTVHIKRLITIDLHAIAIQGFMDSSIVFDHIPSTTFINYHLSKRIKPAEWCLCSPDSGGLKRVQKLASLMGIKEICVMDKERSRPNEVGSIKLIIGNVEGRKVLVFDDMIDTGGTLNNCIEHLYASGAIEVMSVATHGIFSGNAFETLRNKHCITTNSTNWNNRDDIPTEFECLDLRPFVDDIIYRVFNGISMGSFFTEWNGKNAELHN